MPAARAKAGGRSSPSRWTGAVGVSTVTKYDSDPSYAPDPVSGTSRKALGSRGAWDSLGLGVWVKGSIRGPTGGEAFPARRPKVT